MPSLSFGGETMKCKVLKKYYDPFEKVTKRPGELVEIPEEYIEAYSPYVCHMEAPAPEKVETKAIEKVVPPTQKAEKPIKKKVR